MRISTYIPFLILCFFVFLSTKAYSQFNFYKFSAGVGTGLNLPFADTKKANYSLATRFDADYYFTPYISSGLEFQYGNMRGGEFSKRHFNNDFKLIAWNAKMQLGQFYDRYDRLNFLTSIIRGLYMGAGLGVIRNNAVGYREDADVPGGLITLNSLNHDLIFPFSTGINLYLKDKYGMDRWELNFEFQFVSAMEDAMDADISPTSNFNDVYNYVSGAIKYRFGPIGLDKRKNRLK